MINILAINTVDKNFSIALLYYYQLLFCFYKQTINIFNIINNILYKANINLYQLDIFIFNNGPGSFTGIRLSYAFANVLNLSLGTKIIGISNLDIILYKNISKIWLKKHIILIICNSQKSFYICEYWFNKSIYYLKKKDLHFNNINYVINFITKFKYKIFLYINKYFYIQFLQIIILNYINNNIKLYVKSFKINTTAKDLIFFINLFIYKSKFKCIVNKFYNNKINYIHNNNNF